VFPSSGEFTFFGRKLIGSEAEMPGGFVAAFTSQEEGCFELTAKFPTMKLWGHDLPQGPGDELPQLMNYLAAVSKMHLA
jgi:hypothetical protein